MSKQPKKLTYTKLGQREHVLKRPDTYVGSIRPTTVETYVADLSFDRIYKKEITYIPALHRIFVEVLSNVIDNKWRSEEHSVECNKIKIAYNSDKMMFSITNDGLCPFVEKHSTEDIYIPELIFGTLLTSSNYDDEEERMTSGRNGIGVKAVNIFSSYFEIKIIDSINQKEYTQVWEKNMSERHPPKIKSTSLKNSYTTVSWIPDFNYFKIEGYSEDMLNLYTKYILDMAMITKLPIYYNDSKIHIKTLLDYSKLYLPNEEREEFKEFCFIKTKDSEVVIQTSEKKDSGCISFVNGVNTIRGGVHVDEWYESILRPLVNKINNPKRPQINISHLKSYFRMYVVCMLKNPEFDTQSKEFLTAPKKLDTSVLPKHTNSILKWSFREKIEEYIKSKELSLLKDKEKKTKSYKAIPGFDPANNAGGKNSSECTLILCEGTSAKTYAVTGIPHGIDFGDGKGVKEGRDWFGIYPLRGKLLNTRNANVTQISKNKEITELVQILGIKHGEDYSSEEKFKTLNYGRLMIMTDQDVDGAHIRGLIINFIDSLFPSLLDRNFILSMQTPIVRMFFKSSQLLFYNIKDYKKAKDLHTKKSTKFDIKYYKGLGTSNDKEIAETFGKKLILYNKTDKSCETINKAFHSKLTDERKEWMREYDPEKEPEKEKINDVLTGISFEDFIDHELIEFSIDDCKRNIPNLMDGLKESQRKVLYACFLKNLKWNSKTLKVAQLAGYVSEKTSYHHGEQCLFDTITRMACSFVDSNNIPLLFDDGQFGSRTYLGKDAANARYIFTKLNYLTRLIFKDSDDGLLDYLEDDGVSIEPRYFVPIIPMILVNGCEAIGTGWSSSIPEYNPLDIIERVKDWIKKKGYENNLFDSSDGITISEIEELVPYYRNFKGSIEKFTDDKYFCYGNYKQDKKEFEIDEIPIGYSLEKYKEILESFVEDGEIKGLKNYSTKNKPLFKFTSTNKFDHKKLKLVTTISTTNMVLFTEKGKIKKYSCPEEILNEFCKVRYHYYILRKQKLIKEIEKDLLISKNKRRFLKEVMSKELIIDNRDTVELIEELESKGYYGYIDSEDTDETKSNYNYLLRMHIRSFTKQKIEELEKTITTLEKELQILKSTSESEMWVNDLDILKTEYQKYEKESLKNLEEEKMKKK